MSAAVLFVAGALMLAVLLYVGRWLLYWADEWNFLLSRPDLTVRAVLYPHVDNIAVVPVLVYQGLLRAVGLGSYLPYLLIDWAAHFLCVALLFKIVTRRSGPLLGLVAALSLLFLGSAWEVLLHPFQMQYLFGAAGGLIAIDQLDRADRSGTRVVLAGIALLVAVMSSGVGPIFVGLILVWTVLRRDRSGVLAVVPAVIAYGAWYLTWGRQSVRFPIVGVPEMIETLLYGLGASVIAVIGLPPVQFAPLGLVIAALGCLLLLAVARRGWRPDPLAVAAAAALTAEFALQAYFRGSFGVEHAARSAYLYPAGIFIWLGITGIVGRGLELWMSQSRVPVNAVRVAAICLVLVAAVGNMRQFTGAAIASRPIRATELAELRLIEASRGMPGLAEDSVIEGTGINGLTPRAYYAAIDRFGRPTMPYDWEPEVDEAALEVVARQLFPAR